MKPKLIRTITILVMVTAISLFFTPQETHAATKTWIGGTGNWSEKTNWSPLGLPSSLDNIIIDADGGKDSVVHLDIDFTLVQDGSITISPGDRLIIDDAKTLANVKGTVINNGSIDNYGHLDVSGLIDNAGSIHNYYSGEFLIYHGIENGGTITNEGLIKNGDIRGGDWTITNKGLIENHFIITNYATIENLAAITNYETINNNCLIKNFGTIYNEHDMHNANNLDNYGTIDNNGFFDSFGTLNNFDNGIINNNHQVSNEFTGTINNCSTINNHEFFNNIGTVNNYFGGIFNNLGILSGNAIVDVDITFPDTNLEALIREVTAKPTGDIYLADLLPLVTLDGHERGITDLSGLEHCFNLTYLNLDYNQISDIAPLQGLTSLTHLGLANNLISSITPLQNLTLLIALQLQGNQVSDITSLQNLTSLHTLYLTNNKISDITSLQNLTRLHNLYLANNKISDIQPLVDNPSLSSGDSVYLRDNPLSLHSTSSLIPILEARGVIVDYNVPVVISFPDDNLEAVIRTALGKPTGEIYEDDLLAFTMFDASGQGIQDLTGLEYCVNLTYLNLNDNQISDISPLRDLAFLGLLELQNNQISDVSPLAGLTGLLDLRLSGNQISDIFPLRNLTGLTDLSLANNQISDVSPLHGLSGLVRLYLPRNQIDDLTPLQNLTSLTQLSLYTNQISDISALKNLTGLTLLRLGGNQISDIAPLKNLTNLTGLYLHTNQIRDIEALVNNPGLDDGDSLNLSNNPLSLYSISNLIPVLEARGVAVAYTAADSDIDGDGILDIVDVAPGTVSVEFSDGTASGSVKTLDSVTMSITDAPQPTDGIEVVVTGSESGYATIKVNVAGGSTLRLPPGDYILTTSAADDSLRVDVMEIPAAKTVLLQRPDSTATYSLLAPGAYTTKRGSVILEVSDGGLAEVEYSIGGTTTVITVGSGRIVDLEEDVADGELQEVKITAVQGEVTVNGAVVPEGERLSVSVNHPPASESQLVTTNEDTLVNIDVTATDADGDTLTYTIINPAEHGSLSGTAPDLAYTPAPNYNGPDSFTYMVNDGTTDSELATVTITVMPVNDAPVIASVTVDPGDLWPPNNKEVGVTITVTADDPDGDDDIVRITYTVAGGYGGNEAAERDLPADGRISLRAARDGKDKDGLVYTVTVNVYDASGLSDSRSVDVIVPHDQGKDNGDKDKGKKGR